MFDEIFRNDRYTVLTANIYDGWEHIVETPDYGIPQVAFSDVRMLALDSGVQISEKPPLSANEDHNENFDHFRGVPMTVRATGTGTYFCISLYEGAHALRGDFLCLKHGESFEVPKNGGVFVWQGNAVINKINIGANQFHESRNFRVEGRVTEDTNLCVVWPKSLREMYR